MLILALTGSAAGAQDDPEFIYDIYICDSTVTVWIDLTPVLTAKTLERLKEGVDLAIECRADLSIPRRLWGDRQVASGLKMLRLSQHQVTKAYLLETGDTSGTKRLEFPSMAFLFQHLRDSVEIPLFETSPMDPDSRHFASLRITTISLTDLNLAEDFAGEGKSGSPVRYLFRQFLSLTGYGRQEYSIKTRSFSLSELEVVP